MGGNVEINRMLKRLQAEAKEKDEEIKRLEDMNRLHGMVSGPIKTGKQRNSIYTCEPLHTQTCKCIL